MMYQYGNGFHAGYAFAFGIHAAAMLVATVGVVLLVAWAIKNLAPNALWKWGWIAFVGGVLVCLLTIPALFSSGMMRGFDRGVRYGGMPMMQGRYYDEADTEDGTDQAAQEKEEAEGKALYDKLKTKKATCADLADKDFELVGEYVMGQMLGSSHADMNVMMKRMMGPAGEEQMHINMGKSATGCYADAEETDSSALRGMMDSTGSPQVNGGGMMVPSSQR